MFIVEFHEKKELEYVFEFFSNKTPENYFLNELSKLGFDAIIGGGTHDVLPFEVVNQT